MAFDRPETEMRHMAAKRCWQWHRLRRGLPAVFLVYARGMRSASGHPRRRRQPSHRDQGEVERLNPSGRVTPYEPFTAITVMQPEAQERPVQVTPSGCADPAPDHLGLHFSSPTRAMPRGRGPSGRRSLRIILASLHPLGVTFEVT
jgi:hypothetical protein